MTDKPMTLEERAKFLAQMAAEYFDCADDEEFVRNFALDLRSSHRAVELAAYERAAAVAEELMVDVHDSFTHAFKEGARCCRNEIRALASGGIDD